MTPLSKNLNFNDSSLTIIFHDIVGMLEEEIAAHPTPFLSSLMGRRYYKVKKNKMQILGL